MGFDLGGNLGGRDIVGKEEGFKLRGAEEQGRPTAPVGSGDLLVSTSFGFVMLLLSLDIEL